MFTRFAIASAATLIASPPTHARPPASAERGEIVSSCSRYGNGCYSAPVRQGPFGPQMRLKGGTWIDCKGSCKDTLREETVDFWETQRERSPQR